jgi:alanine racemase
MKTPPAHSWVEVSERALVANIRAHRCLLAPKTQLMAVIKSNAYGHGLELVARVAERSRLMDWLGTASLAEAEQIRRAGVNLPILVLSYYHPLIPAELARGISHRISFMVYEEGELKALERAAKQAGKPAHIHLKLETGMARLGLFPVQAKKCLILF